MSTEQFSYAGLTSSDISKRAKVLFEEKRLKTGEAISRPVAVALIIKSSGQELLKKIAEDNGEGELDVNSIYGSLDYKRQEEFLDGLGGVLLGSIVQSIEEGAVRGWKDKLFVEHFNEGILGTRIPTLTVKKLVREVSSFGWVQPLPDKSETEIIRGALRPGKNFIPFIETRRNNDPLPWGVRCFLFAPSTLHIMPMALHAAALMYMQALDR